MTAGIIGSSSLIGVPAVAGRISAGGVTSGSTGGSAAGSAMVWRRMRAVTGCSPAMRRAVVRSGAASMVWAAFSVLTRSASSATGGVPGSGVACDSPALS